LAHGSPLSSNIPPMPAPPTDAIEKLFDSLTLAEWDRYEAAVDCDTCLHHLFEAQVERAPEAVALVHEGRTLSYRDLDRQAERLARQLRRKGVGPDVLVGICVERSLEMVVGLLGILKAGGAFLPLDPGYPSGRLALILKVSDWLLVLRSRSGQAVALPAGTDVLYFEDLKEDLLEPGDAVGSGDWGAAENLAYVLFTSGSTGQPKGVMVTHRSIVNHMIWMQERFPVTASDAVLQKTPTGFDASVWELFLPLMTGARMVLARQDGHRDPGYLIKVIGEQPVTVVQFVPALLEWFVEHPKVSSCTSLTRVFAGGEALTTALCERLLERPDVELVNLYGPTETTIDASFWVYERGETSGVAPIGGPVANTQLYVLDSRREVVLPGVVGELFIGGAQSGGCGKILVCVRGSSGKLGFGGEHVAGLVGGEAPGINDSRAFPNTFSAAFDPEWQGGPNGTRIAGWHRATDGLEPCVGAQ
jgi:amino acid adenylation domain-containing protein